MKNGIVFVVPDLHSPYHDEAAWKECLRWRKIIQPKITVLIGDAIDCYTVSTFLKSPERRLSFRDELDITNAQLDRLGD